MTQATKPLSKAARFVERLNGMLDDSGAMAALRRGLGKPPGEVAEMHPYVLPWLSKEEPAWSENAYYVIAALFAYWHQGREPTAMAPDNLGASLADLQAIEARQLGKAPEGIERRFVALLNSHIDDLPDHLRHAVGRLKSKEVPVNWVQLLEDLRHWDSDGRWVQRQWARGFWKATESPSDELADKLEADTA